MLCLLWSCDSAGQFKSIGSEMIWRKDNVISFETDYTKSDKTEQVWIMLRHTMHCAYKNVPIQISIEGPNDFKATEVVNILLRDETGLITGSALGDIVDIEHLSKIKLGESGKYTFKFAGASQEDLVDIMEVGLEIRKK